MLTDCSCQKCVNACECHPGWFAPGEAEKVAEFLELDFKKFEELFLIKDHCSAPYASDAPYVYSPRKVHEPVTSKIRTHAEQRKQGHCVFLIKGRCSIHPVKPFECRNTMGCDWKHGTRDELESKWIEAGAPLGMRPEQDDEGSLHFGGMFE